MVSHEVYKLVFSCKAFLFWPKLTFHLIGSSLMAHLGYESKLIESKLLKQDQALRIALDQEEGLE